jgi:hypothetical protein
VHALVHEANPNQTVAPLSMQTASKLRLSYVALVITGCVAPWYFHNAAQGLNQSLRIAGGEMTNGFVLVTRYGFILYIIPVGLSCLYLASSRTPFLQQGLFFSLVGSGMTLTYLFAAYLLLTPFIFTPDVVRQSNRVRHKTNLMNPLIETLKPALINL